MQLFQNIALDSSVGEYLDSESDEVSNMVADIQNEKDFSNSDYNYAEEEITTNTDDGTRALDGSDDDRQTILRKRWIPMTVFSSLQSQCWKTTRAEFC